jgi:adenine-specific DNA-methyltransferase
MANSISARKRLGAYYTEAETADAIARLALARSDQRILDPCFGGCAFLEAIRTRMTALGSSTPMRNVFGVDLDRGAKKYLDCVRGALSRQFLFQDFLRVEPDAFGVPFDVVLGNPPFVRHHLLPASVVARAQARVPGISIPKTADSWLYFFHHSLRFLKRGGALALVLPGALLNAEYAESARHIIATQFAVSHLYLVRQRLFADALESPVILVARGFGEKPIECRLSIVDTPQEIADASPASGKLVDLTQRTGPWRLSLLSETSRRAFSTITRRGDVCQLGELVTIHIGVVTGANDFFTMTSAEAKKLRLPASALRAILTTTKQFRSLQLSQRDARALRSEEERVLLLDTNKIRPSVAVHHYLESEPALIAQKAFKCREREVWHQLDDLKVPEAFLSYVIDRVPRLVLNRARALCTNAIHRVWWRHKTSLPTRKGHALALTSSLGGLSAELYGRVTGGGALKIEPGEAAALWLPTSFRGEVRINRAFERASSAVRAGDWQSAREIADQVILGDELGLRASEVAAVQEGHDELLAVRFSLAARATKRTV